MSEHCSPESSGFEPEINCDTKYSAMEVGRGLKNQHAEFGVVEEDMSDVDC